eukprot:scaffold223409_cov17-Tisochrysis_lutea.AAC.1
MILLNMRHALWHAERGPPERGYVPSRASRGGAAKAVRGRPGAVQQELFEAAQVQEKLFGINQGRCSKSCLRLSRQMRRLGSVDLTCPHPKHVLYNMVFRSA